MNIDVTYDLVCPWCYLGLTQLSRALRQWPGQAMEVNLFPFQLTPDVPPAGVAHRHFFEKRVGENRAVQIFRQMEGLGRDAGIDIDYERIDVLPNTSLAHQLIQIPMPRGQALALAIDLMAAHFSGRKNIGERPDLLVIAKMHGLVGSVVEAHWNSPTSGDLLRVAAARSVRLGIRGVPHYMINGEHSQSAQTAQQWLAALERASVTAP